MTVLLIFTLTLLCCCSTVAPQFLPSETEPSHRELQATSLCGDNEIAEAFYYSSQIEFNTTDSCKTEQLEVIQLSVVKTLYDVGQIVRETLSNDRSFAAARTKRAQKDCAEPIISKVHPDRKERWKAKWTDRKQSQGWSKNWNENWNSDWKKKVKQTSRSAKKNRKKKWGKAKRKDGAHGKRVMRSLGLMESHSTNRVLDMVTVSLQVDLLSAGQFVLCYPAHTFQPKDSQGRFSQELQNRKKSLDAKIHRLQSQLDEAWTEFESQEQSEKTRMVSEKAELVKLIEAEVYGFAIEQEELNEKHHSELVALKAKHSFKIPSSKIAQLEVSQDSERLQLLEKQRVRTATHEAWMAELEESQRNKNQLLDDERKGLDTTRQTKRMEWDFARAKFEARMAQEHFLQKPQNRQQKKFDTIHEDFLSFQLQYEKKLGEELSTRLWLNYKESDCFTAKPNVIVSVNRIPSNSTDSVCERT